MEASNKPNHTAIFHKLLKNLYYFSPVHQNSALISWKRNYKFYTHNNGLAISMPISVFKTIGCQNYWTIDPSVVTNERVLQFDAENPNRGPRRPPELLRQNSIRDSFSRDTVYLLLEYAGDIQKKHYVKHSLGFCSAKEKALESYPMNSVNRGVLFLVNIINFDHDHSNENYRWGADVDKHLLLDLFRQMGFKLFYYENLRKDEFVDMVFKLMESRVLKDSDCLVFAVLSHGGVNEQGKTEVHLSDYIITNGVDVEPKTIEVEHLVNWFNHENCPSLINKPKIFIFPCCRGDQPDRGMHTVHFDNIQTSSNEWVPTISDVIICYGTVPGFSALRDPLRGSWYIECLTKVFAENAYSTELNGLLKLVEIELCKKSVIFNLKQTPCNLYMGFNKEMYFNPGYYEDNLLQKISNYHHNLLIEHPKMLNFSNFLFKGVNKCINSIYSFWLFRPLLTEIYQYLHQSNF